ncbi:class I SAM-dependent methyltransferase [Phormidium sp. CLA17]|uniref:class I SAM-dependent methyltransferase n=1 Tax=Leptolyngbya sp. Cla-17 TaxID=2803751 RepID=UPI001491B9C9|nr:class I SAM-dependent methyltransferase [Leptolyngbya sp. Cla-17]MBM0740835.1 class I SAM-dependent methyltransferase [Leptolyngbya sp. Cla-17]
MPQVNQGIRSVLSIPTAYRLFGQLIGGASGRKRFVKDHIRPRQGDRILDIGCGPGVLVPYLPAVDYVGFDASEEYIQAAQEQYGDRATFYCKQVSTQAITEHSQFDLVLAVGVLHHLDDIEALQLCRLAQAALKPGGRLITFDGCYLTGQSPIAHYLLTRDRGQNVRDQDGYTKIVSQVFSKDVVVSIRHDLLRIPYTHIILECTK